MNLQNQIDQLFSSQRMEWELLNNNIKQLDNVEQRSITWGNNIEVVLQYNPARITSASAKVDKKSIQERACFLCAENRPKIQKGVPFMDKYIMLCNPYPILQNHLTIPLHSHVPQLIGKKMDDMLSLSEQLPEYIVFYNGPKCGASAPDHFHFQAGLKTDILLTGDNDLRSCLRIESDVKEEAEELFYDVYNYLKTHQPDEDEPMMNIISFMENSKYVIHVFPRKLHRPWQYFTEGKNQLLISPGALDMAGMFITPRKEDFEKLSRDEIEDIYAQVSMAII
ncbi:MAG: DUF4922 domain-containing protein [Dysgonamonadaceae bacterium]|nr:DUF4922 domain-containing protein [Dysgonamonadaceae bacterium]MDD3356103.1 DUF4922 domain-containing protein [Dysgonamonadaceae bacterium]MDD3727188.1 DUF4922 domain-containing protein [Dysgonamonadaceae bacterium]MDD4246759.1 DUF4922 domain-containing protein [Dysgonamonadaceae bacterium]MDD4605739.1 DUF4922 domain-containing protein [Dysgonamonadaceae bacterium]